MKTLVKNKLLPLVILLLLFIFPSAFAQKSISDSTIAFPYIGLNYGFYIPQGNLEERFGNHFQTGLTFGYKTKKNWNYFFSGNFLFGEKVKEFPLLDIATGYAVFVDEYGSLITPEFSERGGVAYLGVSKVFPKLFFKAPNPNSGFIFSLAGGYLFHKINMQAAELKFLTKDFKRGYDRLSGGFGVNARFGYLFNSNDQYLNFMLTLEANLFKTNSLRKYQFDKGEFDEDRNDVYFGINLTWMLPMYRRAPKSEYYY